MNMLKKKNGYKFAKTQEYLLNRFNHIGSRHFESKFTLDQYKWLYKKTIQYASTDSPCLDWGCGHGHFSLFLQENNFLDIYGCAFEYPFLLDALSKKKFSFLKLDEANPNKINFNDEMFASVFSVGVLEHVRETNGNEILCLKEINRILKKDGLFICAHFPRKISWIEFLTKFIPGKRGHKYLYNKRDISKFLSESNFTLIELKSYGIIPRNSFSGKLSIIGNLKFTRLCLNIFDAALSFLLPQFTQNYGFICRKN